MVLAPDRILIAGFYCILDTVVPRVIPHMSSPSGCSTPTAAIQDSTHLPIPRFGALEIARNTPISQQHESEFFNPPTPDIYPQELIWAENFSSKIGRAHV